MADSTEVIAKEKRRGSQRIAYTCAPGKNFLYLVARFGEVPAGVGFAFLIEQLVGADWCVFGGADVTDLARTLNSPNKDGTPRNGVLEWRFHEQLVDDCKGQQKTRDYEIAGKQFSQLAMCPEMRISTAAYTSSAKGERTDADLEYSVDVGTDDRPYPVETIPAIIRSK